MERCVSCNQAAGPFSPFPSPSHRLLHQRTFARPHFRDPAFKVRLYFSKRKILKSLPKFLQGQKEKKKSSNCNFCAHSGVGEERKRDRNVSAYEMNPSKRAKGKALTFVLSHHNFCKFLWDRHHYQTWLLSKRQRVYKGFNLNIGSLGK